jgi:uncharacterized protein YidB (DUF937 family)
MSETPDTVSMKSLQWGLAGMIIDDAGAPPGRSDCAATDDCDFGVQPEVLNMGLLDGLLGGAVGAEMVTVVNGLIEKHGGIQGIVAQLEQQGLGGAVRSWVGTGANESITADQIRQAFGSDTVKQLAAKVGLTPQDLATKLSAVLPQAIDKLTPGGTVAKT